MSSTGSKDGHFLDDAGPATCPHDNHICLVTRKLNLLQAKGRQSPLETWSGLRRLLSWLLRSLPQSSACRNCSSERLTKLNLSLFNFSRWYQVNVVDRDSTVTVSRCDAFPGHSEQICFNRIPIVNRMDNLQLQCIENIRTRSRYSRSPVSHYDTSSRRYYFPCIIIGFLTSSTSLTVLLWGNLSSVGWKDF
jgi:hypothetical protein